MRQLVGYDRCSCCPCLLDTLTQSCPPSLLALPRLLQDKPNFKFEFREQLQFKNVEDLVSCYYLVENTEKEDYTSVVISEEPEHVTYQFMMTRPPGDTPPSTPLPQDPTSPLPPGLGEILSSGEPPKCPFSRNFTSDEPPSFFIPEFNVIHPTPGHTPNPTPPTSKRSSLTDMENQFRFSPLTSPPLSDRGTSSSPEHDLDTDMSVPFMTCGSVTPPLGRSVTGGGRGNRPQELELPIHSTTPFMDTMRKVSLSPLREDLDEEELLRDTPTDDIERNSSFLSVTDGLDEGIVMRKLSDTSIQSQESSSGLDLVGAGKTAQRRISDTSNHSGENGIDSHTGKLSEVAKDNYVDRDSGISCSAPDMIRKCSNSSSGSVEDELNHLRRTRLGSVKGKIEIYNSLERHRKTGLSTTAYCNGTELPVIHLTINSSPVHHGTPPPSADRPNRKSLDSMGSSSSNE